MRADPISQCERNFIIDGLKNDERLDGRHRNEFRQTKLIVGSECGTALCTMGDTKVLCAVSATLDEPGQSRPNKGLIVIDVDMSPMSNPANEHNRLGERGQELTKLLELVLRDSRCIDVESLCVRAYKEVWKLRVDVRVLDDDGSLLDCACLSAIAALHHFRRPNVTVEPHHTIIHSEWEKALIPLNIYHMPVCVTFGFLNKDQIVLVDPTDKEQQCLSGCLVVACNKRREVCALHQSTNLILSTGTIEDCVRRAMQRAINISDLVSTVIHDDSVKRAKYTKPAGFETTITKDLLTTRDAHPDELIAPSVECPEPKPSLMQPSVILNENALGDKGVKMEYDEDQAIQGQVDTIAQSVNHVQITKTIGNRAREEEEVADLLDDLEGETFQLESISEDQPEIDLIKAKKKK